MKRSIRFLLLVPSLMLAMAMSSSAQNVWLNTNGSWHDTANWNSGLLPVAGQAVEIGWNVNNNTATISAANAVSGNTQIGLGGAGNSGTVIVENARLWTTGDLFLGNTATTATLTIQDGAVVTTNNRGRIGVSGGSNAFVTVTGADSEWNIPTNTLRIGSSGNGTLTITEGGTVAAARATLGTNSGSSGQATIGGGIGVSQLLVTEELEVGSNGVGTMEILNNGLVVADSIAGNTVSTIAFSGGELRISGVVGGTAGNALVFNAAGGTIDVVNSSATVTLNGDGSGAGGFTKTGAGTLTMNGTSTHAGPTLLNEGKLMVHGSLSNTSVTAAGGTVLGGTGFIGGDVFVQSGATRAPGLSPGTMSGTNEFWAGGGIYEWEINDALGTAGIDPGWDLISLSGQLDIQATSANPFFIDLITLDLFNNPGLMANFNPLLDTEWTILSTIGGILNFSPDKFTLLDGNFANPTGVNSFSIGLTNGDNDLTIFFAAIPEPSRAMLISVALVGLMLRRRR